MKLLGWLPDWSRAKRHGLDLEGCKRAISDNLDRELDYRIEAVNQRLLGEDLRELGVHVPRVFHEMSSARVLVQEWAEGSPLHIARSWNAESRNQLCATLFNAFLHQLLVSGRVHGDPHPGNLLFHPTGKVTLLDHGCVLLLNKNFRQGLLQLFNTLLREEDDEILSSWIAMGFSPAGLEPVQNELPALSRLLFRPFLLDRFSNMVDWQVSEEVEALLGEKKWCFRAAAPPAMLLLLRALLGQFKLLSSLGGEVCLRPTLEKLINESAPPLALPAFDADRDAEVSGVRAALTLHVKAGEASAPFVGTFPLGLMADLDTFLPESLKKKVLASGADLESIRTKLKDPNVKPGVVVEVANNNQILCIWIA